MDVGHEPRSEDVRRLRACLDDLQGSSRREWLNLPRLIVDTIPGIDAAIQGRTTLYQQPLAVVVPPLGAPAARFALSW